MKNLSKRKLEVIWRQVPPDYYEKGKKRNLFQKVWHGRKWKILDRLLTGNPKTILDVGCASGHITGLIKKKFPNSNVTGTDVSKIFIDFAKIIYPNIKFYHYDAHNLGFKDKSFNLIICTEVLEHVVNPKKVLEEIRRCLKDDGDLIVEMDSGSIPFSIVWYLWKRFGPGKVWRSAHLTHFNSDKLEKLILDSGFRIKQKIFINLGMAVFFKCQK